MCKIYPNEKKTPPGETFDRDTTVSAMKALLNKVDDWWFNTKIRFLFLRLQAVGKVNKALHCKFGYHMVRPHSIRVTNSKGLNLKTNYLECPICNKLFFPSEKEKKAFLRIKDQEISNFNLMFKAELKRNKIKTF
jgi:hypothetical protein